MHPFVPSLIITFKYIYFLHLISMTKKIYEYQERKNGVHNYFIVLISERPLCHFFFFFETFGKWIKARPLQKSLETNGLKLGKLEKVS